MARQSRTRYTILGCLTVKPMSGYDIKAFIERTLVHFWSESYGQIYPTLRQLEDEGNVESWTESGDRGQTRRVYRITEDGQDHLEQWIREPAAPVSPRYEHSLKLFFSHNAGPDVALEHVQRLRHRASSDIKEYSDHEDALTDWMKNDPDSHAPYWLAVLRGGLRYSEMVLKWCDETEQLLRAVGQETSTEPAGANK